MNISYCCEEAGNVTEMNRGLKELVEFETEAFNFGMGIVIKLLKEQNQNKTEEDNSGKEFIHLKEEFERECERANKQVPRMLCHAIVSFIAQSCKATTPEEVRELLERSTLLATYHNATLPRKIERYFLQLSFSFWYF